MHTQQPTHTHQLASMPPAPPPEPVFILRGHRAPVQCVAFTPDCKSLAAGDAEGELKLWDVDATQRPLASIRAHESASGILQVSCPSSQPWVISQGRDGIVKCWELHSGSSFSSAPVQQLASGCYNFCRFALLEPGQTSSSCSISSNTPQLLLQQQQHQQQSLLQHPPPQQQQHHSASGQPADVPVVSGFDQSVVEAGGGGSNSDAATGQGSSRRSSSGAAGSISGLLSQQLRQQQQQQDVESAGRQLAALAVGTGSTAGDSPAHATSTAADLTEAEEEALMLRQGGSNANAAEGTSTPNPNSTSSSSADSTATAAAGRGGGCCYLALPSEDPAQLGIWQLGTQAAAATGAAAGSSSSSSSADRPLMLLRQSKGQADKPHRGQCMAVVLLQPQGRPLHALTGYEDGSVALWDTRNTSTYVAAQKLHSEPIMCLAAAPDCCSGFSGSADSTLASFAIDLAQGHLKRGPQQLLTQQGLADVALRPDGRIAATAGWDAKVRVWRCSGKRQPLAILRWHSQQVACVGFSGDSRLLAAGGRDNFISIWSLYPPTNVTA